MNRALLTVAVFAAVATPAHAWTAPYDSIVLAGPALSGDGVAWADGPFNGPISVKRATGAAPATLFTIAREPDCDTYVQDLAATPQLTSVEIRRGRCALEGIDVVADGKVVATSGTGFAQCGISGHDADAGLIAVARYNCNEDPVMIHDVAAGTSEDLGLVLPIGGNPLEIRIAGRYVAVVVENHSGPGPRFEVVVWDRETGAEHYRVDADAIRGGHDYAIGTHQLELQADGRVLYGVSGSAFGYVFGWATKAEPTLHAISGNIGANSGRTGFAGDAIVVNIRSGSPGAVVFGFDGAERNRFVNQHTTGSIDFDGSRLAWADMRGVHSEAYPFTPPPPPPPPAPPVKPTPPQAKQPSPPLATIGGLKATLRARSLKRFAGTATDADGDLLMVRAGLVRTAGKKCFTLQRSGRLKKSPRVEGRCVPAAFLTATGAASWKLMLPRRLPAGRYTLWVQAVDAAGNAQTSFTREAGNLRSFRLR